MFINYDEGNDYLPLPTPILFQRLSFSLTKGSAPTPDLRSNLICGLEAFQASQASFSDLSFSLGPGSVLIPYFVA